jgi:hypothetical protein
MVFYDTLGIRTRPAFDAILRLLDDNQWHTHTELVDTARGTSDLALKTIEELIRKGYRARHYTRTRQGGPVTAALYRRAGCDRDRSGAGSHVQEGSR